MSQSLLSTRNSSFKEDEGTFTAGGYELDRGESRRARVLYDYDATNEEELSLHSADVREAKCHCFLASLGDLFQDLGSCIVRSILLEVPL